MRLLKLVVKGAGLFSGDSFSMDFFAADRVAGKGDPFFNNVFRLGDAGSIYSQNVVAISGVNASGKTTALKIISAVLELLLVPYEMRSHHMGRIIPAKMSERFSVQAIFWNEGEFYLLESDLKLSKGAEESNTFNWFRIEDEILWLLDTQRPNKSMIADPKVFKDNASIMLKRNGSAGDKAAVSSEARKFLRDTVSIVVAVDVSSKESGEIFELDDVLRTSHATEVVHAFDSSVELLSWDSKLDAFHLKYVGEPERIVSERTVREMLSEGTVVGIGMVERALIQLRIGGFLLIDEIEYGLNKSLIKSFIELFQSHTTNPHGAQLIFTTHYIELLDYLPRKDNVFLLVRNKEFATDVVKYSDRIPRIENKKSEVVLANAIKGVMPSYPEVEGLRAYARGFVSE